MLHLTSATRSEKLQATSILSLFRGVFTDRTLFLGTIQVLAFSFSGKFTFWSCLGGIQEREGDVPSFAAGWGQVLYSVEKGEMKPAKIMALTRATSGTSWK